MEELYAVRQEVLQSEMALRMIHMEVTLTLLGKSFYLALVEVPLVLSLIQMIPC